MEIVVTLRKAKAMAFVSDSVLRKATVAVVTCKQGCIAQILAVTSAAMPMLSHSAGSA
jgi:hypothetical protein